MGGGYIILFVNSESPIHVDKEALQVQACP